MLNDVYKIKTRMLTKQRMLSYIWVALLGLSLAFINVPAWAAKKKANKEEKEAESTLVERHQLDPDKTKQERIEGIVDELENPSESQWLPISGKETKFLALHKPAYAQAAFGTLIILHDKHQHPNWDGLIHQLRTQMPDAGWHTLSISVPEFLPKPRVIPPRPEPSIKEADTKDSGKKKKKGKGKKVTPTKAQKTENPDEEPQTTTIDASGADIEPKFPEASSETSPETVQVEALAQRLQSSMDFLLEQESNPPFVLVAIGETASWTTQVLIDQLEAPEIRGFIMVMAQTPQRAENIDLTRAVTQLKLPVLDITNSSGTIADAALSRARAMKQAMTHSYWWSKMEALTPLSAEEAPQTIRRVRGWLRRVFEPKKIPGVTPL